MCGGALLFGLVRAGGLLVSVSLSVVVCAPFPFTCVVAVLDQCLARSSFHFNWLTSSVSYHLFYHLVVEA